MVSLIHNLMIFLKKFSMLWTKEKILKKLDELFKVSYV